MHFSSYDDVTKSSFIDETHDPNLHMFSHHDDDASATIPFEPSNNSNQGSMV